MEKQVKLEKIEEKMQKLRKQREKLLASENKQKRKDETKKKILLGSYVQFKIKEGKWNEDSVLKGLNEFLTKPNDRKLFGLPDKKEDFQPKENADS